MFGRIAGSVAAAAALIAFATVPANAQGYDNAQKGSTIVDVAVEAAGNFKTLVAAVQAAGLAETLSGKGPFTVFAPTDEAFASCPRAPSRRCSRTRKSWRRSCTYHVVPGKVTAAQVGPVSSRRTRSTASPSRSWSATAR